jgi:hypothetical protein
MAEKSLLVAWNGSLGAVSLPMERIDVWLLPLAADPHDSPRFLRYDGGWLGSGLSAWMSLNSGSSSSWSGRGVGLLSSTVLSSSTTRLPLLLAAVFSPNMWREFLFLQGAELHHPLLGLGLLS